MKNRTKRTWNYFKEVGVNSTSFEDCMVSWDFIAAGIIFFNEGANADYIVEYSFNGTDLMGCLIPTTSCALLTFTHRHQDKVYFRMRSAGVEAKVRVEAWA